MQKKRWMSFLALGLLLLPALACGGSPTADPGLPTAPPDATGGPTDPTPTPTPPPGGAGEDEGTPSRCQGLGGEIEVQVLAGPAEVVGLEPNAVGSVPFTASGSEEPYIVDGMTTITYDDVLVRDWGTYEVTMDMEVTIEGECVGIDGSETLNLTLGLSGSQLVKVEAKGFQGEYPWAGEQTIDVSFALEEGASFAGEGFGLVLHLDGS